MPAWGVGIELGRADVRPRVSSPALSVAEWVPSSAMATFPQAPLRSRMVGFPESGSDLGNAHKTFPMAAEFKCSVHMHSATPTVCFVGWFTLRGSVYPGSVSEDHPGTTKCPEPLCLKKRFSVYQRDVVHLLRGHYPSFIARTDSCARPVAFTDLWPNLVPVILAGCYRPLLVNRSFPTLSLQVLPKMPGPLPRRFAGCAYLLLPLQHRPSPKEL